MKNQQGKRKDKKAIFICQVTESCLKIVKCRPRSKASKEFIACAIETLAPQISAKELAGVLGSSLKQLAYNNNFLIIALPRQQATCRYIKIPTQSTQEIEKIIAFQASKYLPYPLQELITGYHIVSTDKEGYSHVNLFIVHKDVIGRYLELFKSTGIKNFAITLSAFGLISIYRFLEPQENRLTMLIDIDSAQAELAIASQDKLVFGRSFRLNRAQQDFKKLFPEEINKSNAAYLKETESVAISQIVILGESPFLGELTSALSKHLAFPLKTIAYYDKTFCSKEFINQSKTLNDSLASLMGLGLRQIPESLNFLPKEIKELRKKSLSYKETVRLFCIGLLTCFVLGLGVAKNLDNKARYLAQLKLELKKVSQEARGLETLEKRIKYFQRRPQKALSLMDILHELHRITPQKVTLAHFSYELDKQIILRGQAQELNAVFEFATQLKTLELIKKFDVKVKYATKKKKQTGEVVDFEIVCLREL